MSRDLPHAFQSPPPELARAWDQFIANDDNHGHAQRGYVGGSLPQHLFAVWQNVTNSAQRVASQTAPLQPQVILDLGASAGGLSLALCRQFPAAAVYALEPEQEAYNLLCMMQSATHTAQLTPLHGVGEVLPLPDASVDLIVCHTVLEHVRDPEKVVSEMHRVLRPGGRVHLELPNYLWPIEPHLNTFFIPCAGKAAMKFLARLQGLSAAQAQFMDHLQLMTKPMLERIMRRQGFTFYNLVADKIFADPTSQTHYVHSGWKRRFLGVLQNNPIGKFLLQTVLAVGLYPSLLYRLEKPKN
ncbi:MAG TPA: methyltransferase domain-containing protein [Alphaproteobacteria bacterium]|nr:methyltransferase domain-containing protein [Alphaproteobacteria bacterium]